MKYLSFGAQKRDVSQIVLGMMRISSMSASETADLAEGALGALDAGINALDSGGRVRFPSRTAGEMLFADQMRNPD